MHPVPNHALVASRIPSPAADWNAIAAFALTFNGYAEWGSFEACAEVAHERRRDTLTELRTCLFFEQRASRHTLDGSPSKDEMEYARDLVRAIKSEVERREVLRSRGEPIFRALSEYRKYSPKKMANRARAFYLEMRRRRSVREFSDRPVPREIIEHCVRTAGTAPNGANMQPWHFVVVENAEVKRRIRIGAEEEEREFYTKKAPAEWLAALAPLGTDDQKPFLETAPYLIVVFAQGHGVLPDGRSVKHYYAQESVGIAVGFLIAAIHNAGLVALTHTPSPMRFLNEILDRPAHERAFLILVVGYPAPDVRVPDIERKSLSEIATFLE